MQKEGLYLEPNEERTIVVNSQIGDKNYLKLEVTTDINIYGTFNYSGLVDESEKGRESFYIPAQEGKQESECSPNPRGGLQRKPQSFRWRRDIGK